MVYWLEEPLFYEHRREPFPLCSAQKSELRNNLKRQVRRSQHFANLVNELGGRIAEELRGLMYVNDASRFETHQPSAGGISGDRIIRQNNASKRLWCAV